MKIAQQNQSQAVSIWLHTSAVALLWTLTVVAIPAAHAQTYSVLHAFSGGADGGTPGGGFVMDRGGNLYGTMQTGKGGVFKLAHRGSGWVLTPLYEFSGTEGNGPNSLVIGPDGNLYGTNYGGGGTGALCSPQQCGTVFKLTPPAAVCRTVYCSWTATILYRFTDPANGTHPLGIVFDQAGNLYGATQAGGNSSECGQQGCGVAFELSPSQGSWTETVIYDFGANADDGIQPYAGVIFDSAGNLYGTTNAGGSYGMGTAFRLTPSGSGWTENILYSFGNGLGLEPYAPNAGLIMDGSGNLYGTTRQGGDHLRGAVYSLSPSNGEWTETTLYSFNDSFGDEYPFSGSLYLDAAGNLYGTTPGSDGNLDRLRRGSNLSWGNVFQMNASNGGWSYNSLYSFTGGSDGGAPSGNVIKDANGNLYGTAPTGGTVNDRICNGGCGVVWEITP